MNLLITLGYNQSNVAYDYQMTIDHHNLGAVLGRLPRDDGRVAAGGDVDVDDGAAGDIVEKHS